MVQSSHLLHDNCDPCCPALVVPMLCPCCSCAHACFSPCQPIAFPATQWC